MIGSFLFAYIQHFIFKYCIIKNSNLEKEIIIYEKIIDKNMGRCS